MKSSEVSIKTRGAFRSTKTFDNLETAANGTEISWKSFQKFRKLLNFRNANHSTENFRNSGSEVEWKENFRENLGIPRKVALFWKCRKIVITGAVNRKMLFHSLLEVAGNSNRKFWLNGKRPRSTPASLTIQGQVTKDTTVKWSIGRSGVQVKKENEKQNSPSCAHVLQKTLNFVISRCCFAEGGKEMYQNLKRTCRAIVLLIKLFVKVLGRCRFRCLFLSSLMTCERFKMLLRRRQRIWPNKNAEMTKFKVLWRMWAHDGEFSILCINLNVVTNCSVTR